VLELKKVAAVLSGVAIREGTVGKARFMRLSDLSDLKSGREPSLGVGALPEVARALAIQQGDLIVAARGLSTDMCLANEAVFGAFVSLDLYLVRPDTSKVEPRYLSAFLSLPSTQALFAIGKQGSGLARLPKDVLEKMRIPIPSMKMQRLIAGLAGTFEDEARLLRKLSDLNSILSHELVARAVNAGDRAGFSRSSR